MGNYQQTGYASKVTNLKPAFHRETGRLPNKRHFTTVYFKEWSLQCQELKAECALEMKASNMPGKQRREAQ